jgi:hypothetical protein
MALVNYAKFLIKIMLLETKIKLKAPSWNSIYIGTHWAKRRKIVSEL